jgi:geranylgeranyl pyrophosphate synthase
MADDLLDAESSSAALGKRAGKDESRNKPTIVKALGLKGAREALDAEVAAALSALEEADLGERGHWLAQAALFAAARDR